MSGFAAETVGRARLAGLARPVAKGADGTGAIIEIVIPAWTGVGGGVEVPEGGGRVACQALILAFNASLTPVAANHAHFRVSPIVMVVVHAPAEFICRVLLSEFAGVATAASYSIHTGSAAVMAGLACGIYTVVEELDGAFTVGAAQIASQECVITGGAADSICAGETAIVACQPLLIIHAIIEESILTAAGRWRFLPLGNWAARVATRRI